MRRAPIPAARLTHKGGALLFLPASRPGEPVAGISQRHGIAAAMVAAIAICSCCSETHARQVAAPHFPRNDSVKAVAAFVVEASHRFGIPAPWIRAVMSVESGGNLRAVSPKGAMGLMQLMPETWADLRWRHHLGSDPFDAHDNIIAGTANLRELYDLYGIPGFLAAYNAGPARWEDHLATGKPLPSETRAYLAQLAPIAGGDATDDTIRFTSIARSWTEASLFPAPATNSANGKAATADVQRLHSTNSDPAQDWTGLAPRSNGLFVVLTSAVHLQ